MSVEEAGEGPALLMLHAGVSERHMWDGQWAWLQHQMRVVRWDWRGFGDTPHVPGPFSYMDDLIRIMDALAIDTATLLGCSFAGGVAIETAILHPDRVVRLALVTSGVPGYQFPVPPAVEALFQEAEAATAQGQFDRERQIMEQLFLLGPGRRAEDVDPAYLTRARTLLKRANLPDNGAVSTDADWSAQGRLGDIGVPVLVVAGDQDVPDVVSGASLLAREIPQTRFEIIANAAHLPNMERPRQFDTILSDWLAATSQEA